MKSYFKNIIIASLVISLGDSCVKMRDVDILNQGNFTDTSGTIKDATDIKMGVAVDYSTMVGDPMYAAISKKEFDAITVGYTMKHGAIVKDNGTYNFNNADAIINAASGMEVFGHVLGWHSNQNATYLKSFAGITVAAAVELLSNPGFESGLSGWSVFNSGNPAGTSTITSTNVASEVHSGSSAMKVVNPVGYPGNQWRVQISSQSFPTTPGKKYVISYWIKAASGGGSVRLSTGPSSAQYQGDQSIGTAWQQVSWTITASLTSTTFLFDMGQAANTYYVDDASVKEVVQAPSGAQVTAKVDEALNTWITSSVNHFKGKVKEWDVVNEVMSPSGDYRVSGNSTDISNKNASDVFFWSDYLGREYPVKAFKYAALADPSAKLFINEYGIENSARKTDSLVAFVAELKSKGAKIDGIGTQMHVNWNSSYALIDSMFIKLAGTGLLVRVSELDVRINPLIKSGFTLTPLMASYQADMYKYIIQSYKKHVPAAQRAGITIWGLTDNTSWLYDNGKDFPLLFSTDYSKKAAYAAVVQALKE